MREMRWVAFLCCAAVVLFTFAPIHDLQTYLCAEHRKKEVTRILASTPFAAIELFQKNRKCGFIAGRAPCTTGATFWLRMHGGPKVSLLLCRSLCIPASSLESLIASQVWYCSGCRDLAFQALQLEAPGATFDLGDNQRKCQYPLADEGGGLCSIQPSYFLVMNGLNMVSHDPRRQLPLRPSMRPLAAGHPLRRTP